MKKKKIIIQNNFTKNIDEENIDEENADIYFKYNNNKIVIIKEQSDSSNKTDSLDLNLSSSERSNKNDIFNTNILNTNNINIARRSRNVIRTSVSPIDDFTLNDDDSSSLPDLIIPTSSVINDTNSNNDDDVQDS